jgi:hypothetical protein
MVAVRFEVKDSATGKPLPARIVLTDDEGRTINSFYTKLQGFFTSTDGTSNVRLKPGKYQLQVYHGIDYLSHTSDLDVINNENPLVQVSLQKWYPLKERGWVNGDGHDHLYTDVKYDSLMLDTVLRICLAQAIDFMSRSVQAFQQRKFSASLRFRNAEIPHWPHMVAWSDNHLRHFRQHHGHYI